MSFSHRDLWDTAHVKAGLARRDLSERKAFFYFITILTFDWAQFTVLRLSPDVPANSWEYTDIILTLLLTVGGAAYLYRGNGGRRGRDFVYRYFPLSVVVGWKFVAIAVFALWFVETLPGDAAVLGWLSTGIFAVINGAMFLRIGRHLKDLARATNP